ncbi:PREDICTED: protein NETWORKED 4B-like isoform X2 [Tarenaya hassleriana]|uniref:protein NETWORKED 4B-like isoform X2 n=1 Tax=Tarenaya hassleriana TaxID=28532 RepID=UPI00053C1E9F|nr:PREDICTED: protein NETWORKED 4B-like isoform X2 [Tarenaya hassleriana]
MNVIIFFNSFFFPSDPQMDAHTRAASENLGSCRWPENSKWVAEVLTGVDKRWLCVAEMDRNIQKMLKLVVENDESSAVNHEENQSESSGNAKEFNCIYRSLAERYDQLSQELLKSAHLSGSDHNASSPATPRGHLGSLKSGRLPVSFGSGSGSSDISLNVDSDSSSEFESESGAFYSSLNHHLVSPGTGESLSQVVKEGENSLGEESSTKIMKQLSYRELTKKIAEYEEDLRTVNFKLQDSEREIEKLKAEIKKSECAVALAENLSAELEKAGREIELRDAVIGTEKRRVFELQGQVLDLETKLADSSLKFENLVSELEVSRECLDASDAEISKLREMLSDCQQNFSAEKQRMETDIACLLERQDFLDARARELESYAKSLDDQIRNSNTEKTVMGASFQAKEAQWQAEITTLKIDLASRAEHIETLNKDFDKHKLSYDMLRAEKDEVSAKADNLNAELRSRNIQIGQMEEHLNQLQHKQNEHVSESGTAKRLSEELRVRVQELEKEAELQRNAISEGEEEKREAIRQLCFSLDHYRSGYRQLVRSLSSNNNKRQVAIAV